MTFIWETIIWTQDYNLTIFFNKKVIFSKKYRQSSRCSNSFTQKIKSYLRFVENSLYPIFLINTPFLLDKEFKLTKELNPSPKGSIPSKFISLKSFDNKFRSIMLPQPISRTLSFLFSFLQNSFIWWKPITLH